MKFVSILETVGRTPLVRLNRIVPPGSAQIYAKLASFNPTQSVKDSAALAMVEDAERSGVLHEGKVVVEPTSGNTGISLAMVCAAKGYKLVLAMPEGMSMERRRLLKAFGAELVLTPGAEGMKGAISKAKEICDGNPNSCLLLQFDNPANVRIHEETTGRDILTNIPDLDAFVAGVGTGGTITGVARALKRRDNRISIVAVEPGGSPVISGGEPGNHKIQGIGAGFVPSILETNLLDRVITVSDEDAIETARAMPLKEGILAGISSGAALWAALNVARELGEGKKVVTILPDTGERYLSTGLFDGPF